jgi:DNA-binding response OmpR family regulator
MNNKTRWIAVVEDEPDILELVIVSLKKFGFEAKGFSDSESFMTDIAQSKPYLIVLDIMLPGADGFEVCKMLKGEPSYKNIPIIVLSARSDESDKILGLELGADDYITKPFSPRELVARVKAVLRRGESPNEKNSIFIGKDVEIDRGKYEVVIKGKKADLTTTEFRVLDILVSGQGRVFTREEILNRLWGGEKFVIDRTIDVHVRNLRRKLGSSSGFIKNVRGIGYRVDI